MNSKNNVNWKSDPKTTLLFYWTDVTIFINLFFKKKTMAEFKG
jgi:hypothetical protein